jgi:hypothetical protein
MKTVVVRNIKRTDADLVKRLGAFGVATAHEAYGRFGLMKPYLRPVWAGAEAGKAYRGRVVFGIATTYRDGPRRIHRAPSKKSALRWLIHLGGPGLILLGLADNSLVPMPGSTDVVTILLAAHRPSLWIYFAFMATLGAVLDPVADKLLLASSFVVLTWGPGLSCPIPVWLSVVVLSRDLIILVSVAVINFTLGRRVFYPSLLGKITTLCQLLSAGLSLLSNAMGKCLPGLEWLFDLTLACTVTSALHYVYLASVRRKPAA